MNKLTHMQKQIILIGTLILVLFATFIFFKPSLKSNHKSATKPFENYFLTPQMGHEGEGINEYRNAVIKELAKMKKYRSSSTPWDMEGPLNTGGRINCIAVHPTVSNTYLVGCADGGIFKTTDGGINWTPIFDNAYALSVSQIVYDNNNPQIIYVGTGDQVLGGYSHIGNGIYKSTNGGLTWTNIGLNNMGCIAKLIIDPSNSSILYAGTTGSPFTTDNFRGMYKSTDAGNTWNQILFLGQNAGIGDMVINSQNPNTIYCTGRRRIRSNQQSIVNGPEAKIYRSTNGGTSWDTLQNGLPVGPQCRIGLAISQTNPNTVYANYVDTTLNFSGLYKTTNGGNNWTAVNTNASAIDMGGFGWYFGEIRLDPTNDNTIFVMAVSIYKSVNGGISFSEDFSTHSDKHDLKFLNSNELLLATDGGFYKSSNAGASYTNYNNFPITQLYKVAYNPWDSLNYYAGAQDNGTNFGSAQWGLNNWTWYFGGDGFQPQFDATDPNNMYAEWQNGNIMGSWDGGNSWNTISQSIIATDRTSWNTPYFANKQNGSILYAGSYMVYKNVNGPVDSWTPISGDLTDGTNNTFHVITSLNQSEINSNILYAGTSDAKVWVTQNDGGSWTLINNGLPNRYISCVKASPNFQNAVFVSCSGYRNNDTLPHIYYSTNNGNSWTSLAGNLPNFPINDIWVLPAHNDSCLMIASDGGVYSTNDKGTTWERTGSNMPIIPVYDIEFNPATKRIFAGTFARSVQSMPIDSIFSDVKINVGINNYSLNNSVSIFPNPIINNLTIQSSLGDINGITIYNLFGQVVYKKSINQPSTTIDCSTLSIGEYFISIETNKGKITKKISVKK